MLFLLRTAFWLTLVLALIPLGSDYESKPEEQVNPVSAFIAAQATVSDIGGFCQRNPQACETGGDAITAIGHRAANGARIVYEYFGAQVQDTSQRPGQLADAPASTETVQSSQSFSSTASVSATQDAPVLETAFGPVPRPKPRSG
ncbi:MAG: DUF5330 domain-containing protein [Roseibium sp.]|uniref:DUF5330 domain-containing protein n=1 Tax=Roseibium sp. TaxID=1936156 RepID=UPI001B16DA43|nr:DUF5330 domain-containing protein [Roseibium sp.]MBO6893634.1 DUF5330 domain-containing protein [Roseibium sp.]MBO6928129.1 DUF5330 domain-containing protein [Roseibium sp.]